MLALPSSGDLAIRPSGAPEEVAASLRTMIASGRLRQGDRLPEIPLSSALGVSRNTLRAGIALLVNEGLVERRQNHGAIVCELDLPAVRDVYRLRRWFELEAVERLAIAPAAIAENITRALAACSTAAGRGSYAEFVEAELAFHRSLVACLGSPRLDAMIGRLLGELRLVLSDLAAETDETRLHELLDTYKRVFELARAGGAAEARALLGEHLDVHEARVAAIIEQREARA